MCAEDKNVKTKMKTKFQANAVYQTCLLLVCSFPKCLYASQRGSGTWELNSQAAPNNLAGHAEDCLS